MTETNGNVAGGPRKNRLRPYVWGGLAALLMLPLVAMQFTSEVNWDETDFLVMGALLAVVGAGYEVTIRLSDNVLYRFGAGVAVVTGFLTVWVNLAVGFIGNEENPWNLLFAGVLLLMLGGAAVSRFRAGGVAITLLVGAVVQVAGIIAAAVAGQNVPFGPSLVFTLAWLLAAGLFQAAAHQMKRA